MLHLQNLMRKRRRNCLINPARATHTIWVATQDAVDANADATATKTNGRQKVILAVTDKMVDEERERDNGSDSTSTSNPCWVIHCRNDSCGARASDHTGYAITQERKSSKS